MRPAIIGQTIVTFRFFVLACRCLPHEITPQCLIVHVVYHFFQQGEFSLSYYARSCSTSTQHRYLLERAFSQTMRAFRYVYCWVRRKKRIIVLWDSSPNSRLPKKMSRIALTSSDATAFLCQSHRHDSVWQLFRLPFFYEYASVESSRRSLSRSQPSPSRTASQQRTDMKLI